MSTPAQWKRIAKRNLITGKILTTYLLETLLVNLVNSLLLAEVDLDQEHLDLRKQIEDRTQSRK